MTRNQIEYFKVKLGERELAETTRHNQANELIAMNNYELGVRSQSEIERHNLIVEDQANQSIAVSRQQAAASMLGAQASMANAAASAAHAQAAMLQAQTAASLLPYQQETEAARAESARQQGSFYEAQAEGQQLQNQYYVDITKSTLGLNEAKANESNARAGLSTAQADNIPVANQLTIRGQDRAYDASTYGSNMGAVSSIASSTISTAGRVYTSNASAYGSQDPMQMWFPTQ